MPRSIYAVLLLLLVALPALAADPQVQRVTTPPALTDLAMHIGGRALSVPSGQEGGGPWQTQWPGAYFDAAFQGSTVYFRVGVNHEILHVVIDGRPPLLLQNPEPGTYRLMGLGNSAHTIRVLVATESQSAPNTFGGFALPATGKALPAPSPTRQIEFIGDSHTVGYGNTSPTRKCTQDQIWATTDDTQASGPLTAAHYGADYQVNAISGRGVVRNYNGFPADTLPQAYPFLLFNKKERYADPAWHPRLLVIALGTNDFSTALNPGEPWKTRDQLHADFEATYVRFLHDLRARNPGAWILLWATDLENGEIEAEAARVVQQAKAQGDTRIDLLPIDHLTFTACDSHPSLADDRTISGKLIQWIDAHPGLWKDR